MTAEKNRPQGEVIQTTDATFQQDVIQRSHELPVVVDFWAAWCQPCRMLGPLLDQLAAEFAGRFVLVKADTEENSQAAGTFQVQGIPAVFAVFQGELIDAFQGLLPEPQLRSWLERILVRGDLHRARKLEEEDAEAARKLYTELQAQHPQMAEAAYGEARLRLADGDREGAKAIVTQLEERGFLEPEGEKLKAMLEIDEKRGADLESVRAKAEADPENLSLQLELGEVLAAHGHHEESLETLLNVIAKQKSGVGERAREIMVDIFRTLPDDSELTSTYRRRLASVLY
jgi:putative thioredoxin